MKITFIVVGRLKEKYFKDAVAEYAKRLSAYCSLDIIEVADEKTKENMTAAQEEQLLEKVCLIFLQQMTLQTLKLL